MSEPVFESITSMDQQSFADWIDLRPRHDDNHYELLNGRVVMTPPAAWPHGSIGSRLVTRMTLASDAGSHGLVFDASQGFELPTGDTVEPDASFVTMSRWRAGPPAVAGRFLCVVPDLVFETLSKATASRDRGEKKAIYAAAGVREYVLLDPRARTLTAFTLVETRFGAGTIFGEDDPWNSATLPGLVLRMRDLFIE